MRFELESRMAADFVEVTAKGKSYSREEMIKGLLVMEPVDVTIENSQWAADFHQATSIQ